MTTRLAWLCPLVIGLGVGCGDAPTQPRLPTPQSTPQPTSRPGPSPQPTSERPTPQPTSPGPTLTPTVIPTPIPAPGDLNGAWTGTLTLSSPCYNHLYSKSCPYQQTVQAQISQSGDTFAGQLTTPCEGVLQIRGTVNHGNLKLDFTRRDGSTIPTLDGATDFRSINVSSRDLCDYWGYDSTVWLQLAR